MDNGGNQTGDDDATATPHLPAIIPPARVPIVIVLSKRVSLPYWTLIVMAMFGSVAAGALAATLWPWGYHNKTSSVVTMLPRSNDVGTPGNVADNDLAPDAEVTKIDLSPVNLNPAPAGMSTPNLSPANLNTKTDLNLTKPVPVKPAAVEPPAQVAQHVCRVNPPKPQIVMNPPRTVLPFDEPASLGLTLDGGADGAYLIICGFAAKSMLSVGHAVDETTWTVPASMIADATVMPPRGFAGPMDLAVTLMNADRSLADRKTVHFQWQPQPRAAPRRDLASLDPLLNYGLRLKAGGNLADARQIFSRVAQTGDPRGAFMLAETYDPISLAKHQLLPKDSDLELARVWYRKASDLGSSDASSRLERLTNW